MNTIETILSRCSVRKYTDQKISDEDVKTILQAGMAGPSAVNARPWQFIVITDPTALNQLADAAGRAGEIIRHSAMTVAILGDLEKAFSRAPEYWVVDGSISGQNMILAAWDKGIGSVWLGQWPQTDKTTKLHDYFQLPDTLIVHSLIAFGYPETQPQAKEKWEPERIHYNKY